MTDVIDDQGYGDPTAGLTYTTQYLVYGGGGMRDQIAPSSSEDSTVQYIRHHAIVPIGFARHDHVGVEHCSTQASFGDPNQPVSGGLVAPPGLIPPDQWTDQYADANERSYSADRVASPPSTTIVPDTLLPWAGFR